MRQLAIATSLGVLIALSIGCESDDLKRASDAGAHHAPMPDAALLAPKASDAHAEDAGAPTSGGGELDLHALLIAMLVETEGSLVARCPCLTAGGVYESMRACTDAVSLGRNWIECANGLDLMAEDDPEIRASLRCNIEELRQRAECLRGSSCSDEDIANCMAETLSCPKLPLELLSQIAVECQIAFSR